MTDLKLGHVWKLKSSVVLTVMDIFLPQDSQLLHTKELSATLTNMATKVAITISKQRIILDILINKRVTSE